MFRQYRGLKNEIYVLFIGKLVTAMGSFVWPMMLFFLTEKLGLSQDNATFLIAGATLLMLPAALLGGKLADKYSRKNIIIVFDCLTVLFYVLSAIFPFGYHTAAFIFFAGLFQTIETPAYDALNADFSTAEQRERAFSFSYLGFNLGYIAGASVAGMLFKNHTALAFLLNGAAIITSTVLIIFFVDMKNAVGEGDSPEESYGEYELPMEGTSTWQILKSRKVVLFMMILGCFAAIPGLLQGLLLPLQLEGSLGADGATLYGNLNSLNGLVVIVFTPLLTALLKRLTEIPKASLGLMLFVAGMGFFAFGIDKLLLFVGMFVFTLGEVVTVIGTNPYTSRRIPASHRGRIGGISSLVYALFQSAVQFGIGIALKLTNNDHTLLWNIFAVIGTLCALLYITAAYRMDKKTFPALYPKKEKTND